MDSELESEEKAIQKPDLRRRIRLSFWLLLLLVAIIGFRVYLVRWPTEGASWYGLTVGKSTIEDVIATLGYPTWAETKRKTETVYHYKGWRDESWRNPIIYFRNNRVIRIRVACGQDTTLWTYVEQFGKPDHITAEVFFSIHGAPTLKGVYWTGEGIYLSGVSESGFVSTITYFRPCPFFDGFCIMAEKLAYSGPAPPSEDVWGIMSPLPTPTLTPIP